MNLLSHTFATLDNGNIWLQLVSSGYHNHVRVSHLLSQLLYLVSLWPAQTNMKDPISTGPVRHYDMVLEVDEAEVAEMQEEDDEPFFF